MEFPDSAVGAVNLIKKMSSFGESDQYKYAATPDPEYKGVWLVFIWEKKSNKLLAACITWTQDGDFSEADDPKVAWQKYGKNLTYIESVNRVLTIKRG
jgi:hypothetical protein